MNTIKSQLAEILNVDLDSDLYVVSHELEPNNITYCLDTNRSAKELDNAIKVYIFNLLTESFDENVEFDNYMDDTEMLSFDSAIEDLPLAAKELELETLRELIEESMEQAIQVAREEMVGCLVLNNYNFANRLQYILVEAESDLLFDFYRENDCPISDSIHRLNNRITSVSQLTVETMISMFIHHAERMAFEMQDQLNTLAKQSC